MPFTMTYVLSKSEVGICTSVSVFENLTVSYTNCLERVPEDDWDNVNSEPIYCCTKSDPQYSRLEYCCYYDELLSQHRLWLIILLLLTLIIGIIFAFTFLLNLYMIVVASSKIDIPNISTMTFLPKPNFFLKENNMKSKRTSRTCLSRSRSRSPTSQKRSKRSKSKEVHKKRLLATPTTPELSYEVKARAVKLAPKAAVILFE